ncbi:MAG TPA: AAA family ATPase, partial [Bacilli bacterium]
MEPLAYRMRPASLDDIVGQSHLVGKNGAIRRMLENGRLPSLILYGNPGIGKTTIANVIACELRLPSFTFNASTDNKAILKDIIASAEANPQTLVIIDEIHRMKKDIQDYLLPHVEKGRITMLGITTVNPYHSVNPAVRSRCLVYKLNSLTKEDLNRLLDRALQFIRVGLSITDEAREYLLQMANGEARGLINMAEAVGFALKDEQTITLELAKAVIQKPSINIDKNEDNY